MKKILVTGFDPFGGEKINPALEVIKLLPKKIGENEVKILEIPTVWKKSIKKIEDEINAYNPDYILSIGQAGGRTDISIERVAINIDDYRIPDNEGNQPIDKKIFENGKDAYFSNLPIKAMLKEIQKAGIPASISNTAGTFVCNHVFYGVRYLLETKFKDKKSGFIHIPYLPEQVVYKNNTGSMGIEILVKGITIAIQTIFEYNEDLKVGAGTIC
ncbi:pyroglutamyl-peptidase I [Fusobacterium gastrosuis]|uniref:pyroglutamyl-peptidase I n=1 Tax=Fusobacterium gastrosuis TaxID=1755100 RepID=UPI00297A94EB|nr:pyroglutamyl-peptidase I [Fusobacteriaceae bacterium]MDD7409912.1 pyroglutamyl-peptidase I [Fusobacteriaceae bacterium]MDY5712493.1 pyroglutamyl-peptidase I [Fusobacterium gastrosuis]MDY5795235.1 pyroglutamyl-peptidase I [Fusobacterium gastrosuis]